VSYNKALLLKRLRTRRGVLKRTLKAIYNAERPDFQYSGRVRRELDAVEKEIGVLLRSLDGIVITEHAILRYLQRVKGLDLEAVVNEIVPETVEDAILELGDGSYPVDGGTPYRVRIRNGLAVTVTTGHT